MEWNREGHIPKHRSRRRYRGPASEVGGVRGGGRQLEGSGKEGGVERGLWVRRGRLCWRRYHLMGRWNSV